MINQQKNLSNEIPQRMVYKIFLFVRSQPFTPLPCLNRRYHTMIGTIKKSNKNYCSFK